MRTRGSPAHRCLPGLLFALCVPRPLFLFPTTSRRSCSAQRLRHCCQRRELRTRQLPAKGPDREMTRTNHYFYHYPCPDGAFAALAGHLYFSHAKEIAVFHPMKIYLTPEEQFDVTKSDISRNDVVYFSDYTANLKFIQSLASLAEKVVILDHHKTAIEMLDEAQREKTLPSNVELHLDINRSGATIAWDYFRSLSTDALLEPSKLARVEEMMSYVQDGDIWTWAIPNSKGFYSGLKYEEIEFDPNVNPALFDRLVNLDVEGVITRGEAEIVKEQSIIDNVISKSFQISIPDEGTFLATFSDHPDIRSQAGNQLAVKSVQQGLRGIGAIVYSVDELPGKYKVSLRSVKTPVDEDAAKVASKYGGGGHRNAASCIVDIETFQSWMVKA